jgi:hypothetical protein
LSGSEKTVIERFSLNTKNRPTIFVSGKLGSPKQVSHTLLCYLLGPDLCIPY